MEYHPSLIKFALGLLAAIPALSVAETWKPVETVAFVGNSITQHAPAVERLGWTGNWGMAATSQENDYVHQLVALIAQKQNGVAPKIEIFAQGGGRLAGLVANTQKLAALRADLIVVQMGENDNTVTETDFLTPYQQVIATLRTANPSSRIVCTGAWSPGRGNPAKDAFIKKVCADNKLPFADLTTANTDPKNRASNATAGLHKGVGWHPSDAGMKAYAQIILTALEAGEAAIPSSSSTLAPPSRPSSNLTTLLNENFDTSVSLNAWTPAGNGALDNGSLRITNTNPKAPVVLRHALSHAAAIGHTLKVTGRIKAQNVSTPPNRWNGIKLMLDIVDAEGVHDYPQARVQPISDLDWHTVSFTRPIPDNTVSLSIVIGLELVSGTAWFDDIQIEIIQ